MFFSDPCFCLHSFKAGVETCGRGPNASRVNISYDPHQTFRYTMLEYSIMSNRSSMISRYLNSKLGVILPQLIFAARQR